MVAMNEKDADHRLKKLEEDTEKFLNVDLKTVNDATTMIK